MRRVAPLLCIALVACAPASVAEAEAQKDVSWLDKNESRAAMEALGRLADHEPKAVAALAKRRGNQDVYHAAWQAHTRGVAWGDDVLRAALSSPAELPLAVAELPPRDPRLEGFAGDLEMGITSARTEHGAAAVSLLASLGPSSQPHLLRLLERPATREATCAGLASPHVTPDSRLALTLAPPDARTSPTCQKTLFLHAAADTKVLDWLGNAGEPALVTAAVETLECPKLAHLWERVFASPREALTDLEPALIASMGRCSSALDPVIARALPSVRRARASILHALEAEAAHAEQLEATCKQLPRLSHGRAVSEEVRTLASSVYGVRCKTSS
ncbi:MAG: hypothetical protein KF764_14145 [Labilithrix sp.]|nr:hypothetical protein [Labilithrix sp.]MBX3221358.1 hypothetical protein [Labilithrix sp.]